MVTLSHRTQERSQRQKLRLQFQQTVFDHRVPPMNERTIIPARIRQRDTVFKAQHLDTGLYVQLKCGTQQPPRLTDASRCTWFTSQQQAIECLAPFGLQPIEIERHDA